MILSYADSDTQLLRDGVKVHRFKQFERVALRKLLLLEAAKNLEDLRIPPGNRLEALMGDRKGQYSIRINEKWRICFKWTFSGATNVEIVNYH